MGAESGFDTRSRLGMSFVVYGPGTGDSWRLFVQGNSIDELGHRSHVGVLELAESAVR
jgi:hypothetical protein